MLQIEELEKLAHKGSETLAGMIAQEQHREGDILPLSDQQAKIQQELEENAKMLQNTMYEGLNSCILSLDRCQNLPMEKEAVINELQECFQSVKSEEDFAQLGLCLFQDISWKQQLGISDLCMQALYASSRILFEEKDYAQSEKAFFVMCSIDPTQYDYWVGLGHSSFQMHNYQQAIRAYSMAAGLAPENIWPHVWAANCFEEEHDFEFAKMALNEALTLQKTKMPKNIELIQNLEARLQKIQTK